MVPRAVVESDVLISLAVLTLRNSSPLSLSPKNLIGLCGARCYGHSKNYRQRVDGEGYALPVDVVHDQGAHQSSVPVSICAMNVAVGTHLAIIDRLEGGDGRGNWIRLDTLIAGRNPIATDVVACEMAGVRVADQEVFGPRSNRGLGPCDMDRIEVVGEKLEKIAFDLTGLRGNSLEM
jgi:hypothetical protein